MKPAMKECCACSQEKPLENFHRSKASPDGRDYRCADCRRQYNRDYYDADPIRGGAYSRKHKQANPEKVRERQRSWRERNPDYFTQWVARNPESARQANRLSQHRRRARELEAPASALTDGRMRDVRHLTCVYCGIGGENTGDHVVPLARGGSHTPENVVPACGPCNNQKYVLSLGDFLRPPADTQIYATHQGAASAATLTLVLPAEGE